MFRSREQFFGSHAQRPRSGPNTDKGKIYAMLGLRTNELLSSAQLTGQIARCEEVTLVLSFAGCPIGARLTLANV